MVCSLEIGSDLFGTKHNTLLTFPQIPSVTELIAAVESYYDTKSRAVRPAGYPDVAFRVESFQYFDDAQLRWRDLEHVGQLRSGQQLWCFQPESVWHSDAQGIIPRHDNNPVTWTTPAGSPRRHRSPQDAGVPPTLAEKVRSVFSQADMGRKGYLLYADLEHVFRRCDMEFTHATAGELFTMADLDRSNHITFDEFLEFTMRCPNIVDALFFRLRDSGGPGAAHHAYSTGAPPAGSPCKMPGPPGSHFAGPPSAYPAQQSSFAAPQSTYPAPQSAYTAPQQSVYPAPQTLYPAAQTGSMSPRPQSVAPGAHPGPTYIAPSYQQPASPGPAPYAAPQAPIGPSGPPPAILAVSGAANDCNGDYHLIQEHYAGMPVWEREGGGAPRYLYSTQGGHWMISDDRSNFRAGCGWLTTAAPHHSQWPHCCHGIWEQKAGEGCDPGVQVAMKVIRNVPGPSPGMPVPSVVHHTQAQAVTYGLPATAYPTHHAAASAPSPHPTQPSPHPLQPVMYGSPKGYRERPVASCRVETLATVTLSCRAVNEHGRTAYTVTDQAGVEHGYTDFTQMPPAHRLAAEEATYRPQSIHTQYTVLSEGRQQVYNSLEEMPPDHRRAAEAAAAASPVLARYGTTA